MPDTESQPRFVRFGDFEADLRTGELRKDGVKLRFSGQPFQVLAFLLERPGDVVTREELQKRLWPDTFVDAERNLNTAVNKIREILGDSAENPRFVETLPRRGYRFIAPVDTIGQEKAVVATVSETIRARSRSLRYLIPFAMIAVLATLIVFHYRQPSPLLSVKPRPLTRITFNDGLQIGATWSPDGRFIAYASDRGGKFEIWVQPIGGGDPVQITRGPSTNWQPDWSPDGRYIAYRSEQDKGGLFIIPVLGGAARQISSFGYYPRWSPDGLQILFQTGQIPEYENFYMVGLDGSEPRKVLTEFLTKHQLSARSAAWHPDGKRISVWVHDDAPAPTIWILPLSGAEGQKIEVDPQISRQLEDVSLVSVPEFENDSRFSWAPSGKAIYFERTRRGATNLWKMSVDPVTLRALSIERLTTSTGLDTEEAISPDGKSLVFTSESQEVRAWLFPFDSVHGRVVGKGRAITSAAMQAGVHSLTRDGGKIAFVALRAGRWGLWEKSLPDGAEIPVMADDYVRNLPQWSPDGSHLAYWRGRSVPYRRGISWIRGGQVVLWSADTRREEPLTEPSTLGQWIYDWSSDGKQLLASLESSDTHRMEIYLLSADPTAVGRTTARKIISERADLWQPHFSPDEKWVVFVAETITPTQRALMLYVTAASGSGSATQITNGPWDDKPRWSPDGKTIYFVSRGSGFFNVWGIHFDPAKGEKIGEPFPVTTFESPALMIAPDIVHTELSLNRDRLVLNLADVSGSIWRLDQID
jgi:Tol biopolymer transport system component/DNA-binding winged helix-turn-helix (wHTH) protein